MKHGRRPTIEQRKRIALLGLNSDNWLIVKDTPAEFVIVHRYTGAQRRIEK